MHACETVFDIKFCLFSQGNLNPNYKKIKYSSEHNDGLDNQIEACFAYILLASLPRFE